MSNSYFQFKQFTIHQDRSAMRVTTDACLFGAWVANEIKNARLTDTVGQEKLNSENYRNKNVLDIGTGTGLLSLMFAQKNPSATIDAIELDHEAFEQAKENVAASPYVDSINIINDDVKTFSFSRKYDAIISNPPFYENELKSLNEKKNIAHHHSGLLLEELIDIIKMNLIPPGDFYILLPFKRNEEFKKILLKQDLHIKKLVLVRQSTSHGYFRVMIYGGITGSKQSETLIDEISIRDDNKEYTNGFKELLKDYYLNLQ